MKLDYSDNKTYLRNAVIALCFAFPASIILRAYTLSVVWFWFVVPLGVRSVGMAHALGIVMLIHLVTQKEFDIKTADERSSPYKAFRNSMIVSVSALVFGSIYHWLMS